MNTPTVAEVPDAAEKLERLQPLVPVDVADYVRVQATLRRITHGEIITEIVRKHMEQSKAA